ncbi:hypothetical protein B0H12DRAFT_1101454 [Mycena haematopus]|nr:hypothetical protein B0H12DRAFT_1101454 [Mycena haematopus]
MHNKLFSSALQALVSKEFHRERENTRSDFLRCVFKLATDMLKLSWTIASLACFPGSPYEHGGSQTTLALFLALFAACLSDQHRTKKFKTMPSTRTYQHCSRPCFSSKIQGV